MIRSKTIFVGEEWDDIFLMPSDAFKLWMFHYRCEWEDTRTSYPGEKTILEKTWPLKRKAMYKARRWLKDHGWLVQTGSAFKGHNPTFRVERGRIPGRGCQLHASPERTCIQCVPPKETLSKGRFGGDAKVSGSSSVYGSGSPSHSNYRSASTSITEKSGAPPVEKSVGQPEPQTVKPNPVPRRTKGKVKGKTAADGTPWPEDFNLWKTNAERLDWLKAHGDNFARIERDMMKDMAELTEAENQMYEDDEAAEKEFQAMEKRFRRTTAMKGKSNPKTESQNQNPTPDELCMGCKERRKRNPTSDYCAACWSVEQERRAKGRKRV